MSNTKDFKLTEKTAVTSTDSIHRDVPRRRTTIHPQSQPPAAHWMHWLLWIHEHRRFALRTLSSIVTLAAFLFFFLAFGTQNLSGMKELASWDASTETANTMIAVVGPLAAGVSAWRVASLRAGDVFRYPNVHSVPHIIWHALAPVICWGTACIMAMQLFCALFAKDAFRDTHLMVMATGLLLVCSCACFGSACAMLLSPLWAAGAAIVIVFLWLLFPSAIEPMWIRHLTGYEDAVGMPGTMLSMRGVTAPILFCCAVILASISVTIAVVKARSNDSPFCAPLAASAIGAVITLGISIILALPFGTAPVIVRDTDTVCEKIDATAVCVWPEHVQDLPILLDSVRTFNQTLASAGINAPKLVSEKLTDHADMVVNTPDLLNIAADDRQALLVSAYTDYSSGTLDGCGLSETWPTYDRAVSTFRQLLENSNTATNEQMDWIHQAISDARAECRANAY